MTDEAQRPGTKLQSIQALRGGAACMVAAMHCVSSKGGLDTSTEPLLHQATMVLCAVGGAGVDIFFVISGFIIMGVADRPSQGARSAVAIRFLIRRALRIYPLYWITLVVLVTMMFCSGHLPPSLHELSKWQVWLLARTHIPLQAPAWSLVFEVWFYVCAGLLLLLPHRLFRWAIGVWAGIQVVLLSVHIWGVGWPRGAVLSKPQVMEFFLGCCVLCLTRWRPIRIELALCALAVAGGVFAIGSLRCYNALPSGSLSDMERLFFYGLPAALIVLALVTLEARGLVWSPVWMQKVGDCSYSIYLWHVPVMTLAFLLFPFGRAASWQLLPRAALEFLVTLVVAHYSYRLIERPSMKLGYHVTSARMAHG